MGHRVFFDPVLSCGSLRPSVSGRSAPIDVNYMSVLFVMTPPIARRKVLLGIGAAAGIAACGKGDDLASHRRGVAVIGIGEHSLDRVIPAILESERCRLTGLVSSSVEKLRNLGGRLNVPVTGQYTYDDLERIVDNPDIAFVYVAVPNALHAEFAIRAARAGKHVLVEKPMAVSVEQCETMIAACAATGTHLAVAYRLQFDPSHRELQRLVSKQEFGITKLLRASIGFPLPRDDWRLSDELSGGVLMEQGVYAVNAACDLAGMQPVEVVAHGMKTDPERFAGTDETVFWSMQFPGGIMAQCATSYTMQMNLIRVEAMTGYGKLEPAYSTKGLRGLSSAGSFGGRDVNQIALQLDEFAACIESGIAPRYGSPTEGLRDVRIIAALKESLRENRSIKIA